jgi:hypothetical protein
MNQKDSERTARRARSHQTAVIRVTRWAHERLHALRAKLEKEIEANPHEYPGRAGRLLTLSDTIVLLCERITP